jgi:hypothetical protein
MDLVSFAKVLTGKNISNQEFWLCKFICSNCCYVDTYPISKSQGDWMFRTKKCYTLWYFWIMQGRRERNRRMASEVFDEERIEELF